MRTCFCLEVCYAGFGLKLNSIFQLLHQHRTGSFVPSTVFYRLWQTAAQQRIFIAGIFGHFQHARHAVWKILNGDFIATFAEHTSEMFVCCLFEFVTC